MIMSIVDLSALSAWSFPLIPVWLGTHHICTSLSVDKFFNLYRIFIINGLSNFLFFNDSKTESESEKIMNLLFLDSVMRSRAMLITQASALNIGVIQEMFFLNISPLCIVAHTVFSSLDLSVKMYKCLGYLSLTFSNSSWKISGRVLFLWNLQHIKFMFGVLMVQGGISYDCVMYFCQIHVYFSNDYFHLEAKGFLWLLCSFGIVLCILDKKYYCVQDLLGMTPIWCSTWGPVCGF